MDWSKAKSILIIALIIINLLLGYVLFQSERNIDTTLKKDFIESAIKLLADKDIKVNTQIPNKNVKLTSLTVEYENISHSTINNLFFKGKGVISSKDEDVVDINYKDENITIINKKLFIYENKSEEKLYDIKSEEEAKQIALDYLQSKNYPISDMKLSYIKEYNGQYNIEFTKYYNDNFVESTFTNVQVGDQGVFSIKRQWLNIIDKGEALLSISSAPKSILSLLSMEDVYGRTIRDISICYYFEPEKHAYIDNPIEAKQGRAIPAWRIQFEDGYKVFIDNYDY